MKIIFGSDEKIPLTDSITKWLEEKNHSVEKIGHLISEDKKWKWAEIGKEVGGRVAKGEFDSGVICCWSGTGVCMAANRFRGARAALCWDAETAKLARKWDNANILCLSLRFVGETVAREILEAWFSEKFDEEELNEAHKLDE
jgi:ribose 5-phosphate isomerase B